MLLLRAKTVSKTFLDENGAVEVLRNIDLSISKGETVSIVGPSGCGKTTLLRILAGLESPSSGALQFHDNQTSVAFVFQKPLLFQWRTVLDNVLLHADLSGRTRKKQHIDRARYLLEGLGLSDFETFWPSQLSGGMAQRVSLARALFTQPVLLFMDEPLGAVDELSRERLWIDFRDQWRRRQIAVVLVTHSIREAVFLSDRVLTMSPLPGRIVSEISIPLGDQRDVETLYTPAFQDLCANIRSHLKAQPLSYEVSP